MLKIKNFKKYQLLFILLILGSFFLFKAEKALASSLAERLSGKILLQVEEKGEAYYLDPLDKKAYYLGRPDDAFSIMRTKGLGISNVDLINFLKNGARADLAGRILLQVQDKGQAYYIFPDNLKLYYLGRPQDAFNIMRQLGLGISNQNLEQITLVFNQGKPQDPPQTPPTLNPGPGEKLVKFIWWYQDKKYTLSQIFSNFLYNEYRNSNKYLIYPSNNPPANFREAFYDIFLELREGDRSIDDLLLELKKIANQEKFSEDQFLEFVMSFIQHIPYDDSKNINSFQNFPYETLYKNSGICSDKSFLALLFLRKMGYGGAIFDFPESKHSAVAVACSGPSSYDSGYCFIETTIYFPIGAFPNNYNSEMIQSSELDWENITKYNNLGPVEIYQKTIGLKKYNSINQVIARANTIFKMKKALNSKNAELLNLNNQLSSLQAEVEHLALLLKKYKDSNDINNYNATVPTYNAKVKEYNSFLDSYRLKLEIYNNDLKNLNATIDSFLQIKS